MIEVEHDQCVVDHASEVAEPGAVLLYLAENDGWFDGLERRLEGRDWIACADFTIADILLAKVLRDIRKTDLLAPYPRLTAYYASALARPAWRHTLSLHAKRPGVEIADIQ